MKILIDFIVVPSENLHTIVIADNSYWVNIQEKPSVIEITPPGASKPVVNFFDKGNFNHFNSINLDLSCPTCDDLETTELPDGIYNITLKGSPSKYNKNRKYLRTNRLKIELSKALLKAKAGDNCNTAAEIKKKIDDIKFLIDCAEANIRFDNVKEAKSLFDLAVEKTESLKC